MSTLNSAQDLKTQTQKRKLEKSFKIQKSRIRLLKTNLTASSKTLAPTSSKINGSNGKVRLITYFLLSNLTICRLKTARNPTRTQIRAIST